MTGRVRNIVNAFLSAGTHNLPDGAKLVIDQNGNYHVEDKDAKITYRAARSRDFNKYLNGSDLLEEFIKYLGSLDLNKTEVMQIPIESFIMWLIIRAAEEDQEEPPEREILMLESRVKKSAPARAHCRCCGRFVNNKRKESNIFFCSGEHMDRYLTK